MPDFKRNHPGRRINFSGGVFTDLPSHERPCEDLLNLLPPRGAIKGLQPRDGVEHVIEVTTSDTFGGVIHEIVVDEMARTRLLTVMNAATGKILRITDHTDQEGRKELDPLGGGSLPVTDTPEPDYANTLYFQDETAFVEAGGSASLTVLGTNSGGTCGVALDLITAEDGVDINDSAGAVTANSAASGTVTVTTLSGARDGRTFDVYLYNPLAETTYLKDPTRCRVTINAPQDLEPWRVVGLRAAWSNTDSTNRAAAEMLHSTSYTAKSVYLDPSEIITTYRTDGVSEIDSTWYMTYSTPSKLILVSIVDQEAIIRPRVIVYDLPTLGALSNTAATPASADWVWDLEDSVSASCNITNFWYDRTGNIACMVKVGSDYRLYRGTVDAAPTDYVTLDMSALDALGSWSIDYDFGFHAGDTAEPCFILEGGRMVFQIDDGSGTISQRWHLVTVQWDGTVELQDTSFPTASANIQFNCIWNTRASTNVIWTGGHASVNHITALGQAPTACTAADDTVSTFWFNQGFGPMTSDGAKMLCWDNDTLTYRVISVSGSVLATLHNVIPSPDQEPVYFADDDRIMVVNGGYKFYNTSDGAEITSVAFHDNPLSIMAWQYVQDPFAHKCYYCNYSMGAS